MTPKNIDGKALSLQIRSEIKTEAEKFIAETGIVPGLAAILIGEDPASAVYVRSKGKTCEMLGFYSVTEKLPGDTSEDSVLNLIDKYNNDKNINGILVQLPLPEHLNEQKILEKVDYKKDVDGFHPVNAGNLVTGKKCFIPCTPYGVIELLRRYNIETEGKNVVVIGRSNIVGRPVANLLLRKEYNSTVTVCHSRTRNIREHTLNADILIAAIGKPDFVKKEFIKEGCVIIDVGINRVEDKNSKTGFRLKGDVDYNDCFEKCGMITPVPGGVGPMTIAMLMRNTLDSAKGAIYGK